MGPDTAPIARRSSSELLAHGLFAALPAADHQDLFHLAIHRRFDTGETVMREGGRDTDVHIVVEGRVSVLAHTPDGDELLLAIQGPPTVLGEFAALDRSPRSATVRCLEPVTTFQISGRRFRSFLLDRPELMLQMLRELTLRLRTLDLLLIEARSTDTLTRLARQLLRLGAEGGRATTRGLAIDLPVSQQQLASLIGVSRESLSIALRALRSAGIVTTHRMWIELHDLERLRAVASGTAPDAR